MESSKARYMLEFLVLLLIGLAGIGLLVRWRIKK